MTTTPNFAALRPLPRHARRRRGSIYAMVLAMTMLITVIGIGMLATSRATSRGSTTQVNWREGSSVAFSAVEQAIAKINADAAADPSVHKNTWRGTYTSGATAFDSAFGSGRLKWVVDDDDDNFTDDYGEQFRIYGVARIGTVKRTYSVQITPGGDGIEALRMALHSSGGVVLSAVTVVTAGPLSTNGNLVGQSNLRPTTAVGGPAPEVAGTAPAAYKPMPSPSLFNTYKALATPISSAVIAGGTMSPGLLSRDRNPYGQENANGIYRIEVPPGVELITIEPARIKGTLLIEATGNDTVRQLRIRAPFFWEPHKPGFASLITRNIQKIKIDGSTSPYNSPFGLPAAAEYPSGSHPSELRGVFHFIESDDVQLNDAVFIRGCLLADGVVQTMSGTVGLMAVPSLYTSPPLGYTKGNRLLPTPGTWKWDAPPAGLN